MSMQWLCSKISNSSKHTNRVNAIMLVTIIIGSLLSSFSCNSNGKKPLGNSIAETDVSLAELEQVPRGVAMMMDAYPDFVKSYRNNYIFFHDGDSLIYDDGIEKNFIEMLDDTDIEDMFCQVYTKDDVPKYLHDVGRGRCEPLYRKMYGNSSIAVRKNLVSMDWFGQTIKFSKINGADEHLKQVALELAQYPKLKKYITNASTFYWRQVRGAKRLSAHSYGIAIDINTSFSNYWLWENPKVSEVDSIKYINRIPLKIVEIFEKNGFIWGGRWYHFDTMHFEYRPELIVAD